MLLIHHFDRGFGPQGWWWGFLGGFVPLMMFLIFIGVTVWAVLRFTGRGPGPAAAPVGPATRRDAALEEVRVRYARGEISREEFVQRSRDLGGVLPEAGDPPPPAGA